MSAKREIRRWAGESEEERRYFRVAFLGYPDSQRSRLVKLLLDGASEEAGRVSNGVTVSMGEIVGFPKTDCLVKCVDFGNRLIEETLYPHFMPPHTLYVVVCAYGDQNSVRWMEEIRRYAGECPVILAPDLTEGDVWKERERIQAQIRENVKQWEGGRRTPRPRLCAVTPFRFRNERSDWPSWRNEVIRRQNGVSELVEAILRQIDEKLTNWEDFHQYSDANKEDYCDETDIIRHSERLLRLYQDGKRKAFPSGGPVAKRTDIGEALSHEIFTDEASRNHDMTRMLTFFERKCIAFPMDEQGEAFLFPALFQNQPDFEQYRGNLRLRWRLTGYPDVCAPMPKRLLCALACQKNAALDLERSGKNVIAFREQGCQIQARLDRETLDIIVRDNADWETYPNHKSARKCLHEFRGMALREIQNCHLEATESVVFHSGEGEIAYARAELERGGKKKFPVPVDSCMGRAGKYSGKAILNAHSYDPKKDSVRVIVRNFLQTSGVFLIVCLLVKFLGAQIPEQLSAPSAFAYLGVFLIILIIPAAIFFWKPKWRKHVESWVEKNPGLLSDILKARLLGSSPKDNPPEGDH